MGEALESITQQTYDNWEVLVVDDGSSDNTQAVVEQYCAVDPRIKYCYQVQQGVSAARNTGFALAAGNYLQLLDADDLLAARKFELQLAQFAKHPTAALVYGDTYQFTNQPEAATKRKLTKFSLPKPPISGSGNALAQQMVCDNIFLISSPLFRRSMLEMLQGFNQAILTFEDWEFWYRAVLKGAEFVYDNEPGTEFYVRAHGSNTTTNRYKMWKYKLEARKSIMQALETMPEAANLTSKDLWRKHQALYHEEAARFNLLYDNPLVGLLHTVRYSLQGEKPVRIWYDSAYWLKERLLGRK